MSTSSPGKTKPEIPEVAVTGTDTARIPGRSTAARKPRLPGATILLPIIGSPDPIGLKPRLRRAFEGEAGSRRSGEGSSDLLGAAQEGLAGMADGLSDGVEEQKA